MGNISEMFITHTSLMENINKKSATQGVAIVENRKMFSEKLEAFKELIMEQM